MLENQLKTTNAPATTCTEGCGGSYGPLDDIPTVERVEDDEELDERE